MAEFNLPQNSRLTEGKAWPEPTGAAKLTEFKIYSWDPDTGANPRTDIHLVDREDCGPMVLDALIWIKSKIDPALTFRAPAARASAGPAP